MIRLLHAIAALMLLLPQAVRAQARIGEVDTTFRLVGRNDRVVVDRYDDPRVDGVSCYVSRAETGGVAGSLGLATDPNRYSIACRATLIRNASIACPTFRSTTFSMSSVFTWSLPLYAMARISRCSDT